MTEKMHPFAAQQLGAVVARHASEQAREEWTKPTGPARVTIKRAAGPWRVMLSVVTRQRELPNGSGLAAWSELPCFSAHRAELAALGKGFTEYGDACRELHRRWFRTGSLKPEALPVEVPALDQLATRFHGVEGALRQRLVTLLPALFEAAEREAADTAAEASRCESEVLAKVGRLVSVEPCNVLPLPGSPWATARDRAEAARQLVYGVSALMTECERSGRALQYEEGESVLAE